MAFTPSTWCSKQVEEIDIGDEVVSSDEDRTGVPNLTGSVVLFVGGWIADGRKQKRCRFAGVPGRCEGEGGSEEKGVRPRPGREEKGVQQEAESFVQASTTSRRLRSLVTVLCYTLVRPYCLMLRVGGHVGGYFSVPPRAVWAFVVFCLVSRILGWDRFF